MIDLSLSMLLARYRILDASSLTVVLCFHYVRTVKRDPFTIVNIFLELLDGRTALIRTTCVQNLPHTPKLQQGWFYFTGVY